MLILSLESVGQNYKDYLEKYWYYRHRLKDKFMYYNGNATIQGAHHVAENTNDRWESSDMIRWADGTWWLGHYIAVLALEYNLLQTNGEDCQETLDELNLAFDTYYRLDSQAEDCFLVGAGSTNGFFLRDDLDSSCSSNFDNRVIVGGYENCNNGQEANVNSQDQCIMMFLGLNLVKKLVSDLDAQSRAESICSLIIEKMRHFDLSAPLYYWWEIRNPITNNTPDGCSAPELFSFCWAEAKAAGMTTGNNEQRGYSYQNKPQFDILQGLTWDMLIGSYPGFDKYVGYYTMVLSTIINEGAGYLPWCDNNVYDWLYDMYDNTKAYEGMPPDVGLFPHLPIIAEILHGYNGTNQMPASLIEQDFLDSAPVCGSINYDYNPGELNTEPPWHTMSLFCPWHRNGEWQEGGEYNMLDYMMLYSAYYNVYLNDIDITASLFSNDTYPEWIEKPEPHVGFWAYTIEHPKQYRAAIFISSEDQVNEGGGVIYSSGESIKFLPGFHANSGSYVSATIDATLGLLPYFTKTNVDVCNGGIFESITADYIPAKINVASKQTKVPKNWQEIDSRELEHTISSRNIRRQVDARGFQNANDSKDIVNKVDEDGFKVSSSSLDMQNGSSLHNVFPNPTNGLFKVSFSCNEKILSLYIVDYTEHIVYFDNNINESYFEFDLSEYASGMYIVKIRTFNGVTNLKVFKY